MADFKISGRMKIKTLKDNCKEQFGSTIRVYNGKRFGIDFSGLPLISKINETCLEIESFKLADPACQLDSP